MASPSKFSEGEKMQRLKAGKTFHIKQKLISVLNKKIAITNATKNDFILELEENIDGVKPSLTIKIKRIIKKRKEKEEI